LLQVRGLTTRFFTQEGVVNAVEDVSFHLEAGETLGVVGESGSGKSITGLSLMRLVPAPHGRIVAGEILLDGEDLLRFSDHEMRNVRGARIAMIFQDPMTSLNPVLTIGRQISEALERHMGMSHRQALARSIELLKLVGIPNAEERIDQYPHQFSGGMRQRVVIAMALSCNPEVIIADEPTTALDVTIQAQILELLRKLQREFNSGIMMITHSMGVVAGVAERIQVMYAGSIVETGRTETIFADPRHPYTVGLMRSIPRLDAREKERLEPIGGMPPDLIDLPDMCPFAPRCAYARDACREAKPPLIEIAPGHSSACFFWKEVSLSGVPEPTRVEASA
jgi:oligopeptide transport system ATP-binding protein